MTFKNNRAPLLSIIKLYASFHHHIWIQTGVTVRKLLSWVLTSVTLTFDLWPWSFAWMALLSLVITPENFMMIQWWEHGEQELPLRKQIRPRPSGLYTCDEEFFKWKEDNKANLRDLIAATCLVISNWIQIVNFSARVTVKFDGWPCKTIGHLFYATSSFVHHFLPIGEFKLSYSLETLNLGQNRQFF